MANQNQATEKEVRLLSLLPEAVFSKASGKLVGYVDGGVFLKRVSFQKHLMRNLNAIGIDDDIFYRKINKKCSSISVIDEDSGDCYTITPEEFERHMVRKDYGYGVQIFCNLKHWTKNNEVQMGLQI